MVEERKEGMGEHLQDNNELSALLKEVEHSLAEQSEDSEGKRELLALKSLLESEKKDTQAIKNQLDTLKEKGIILSHLETLAQKVEQLEFKESSDSSSSFEQLQQALAAASTQSQRDAIIEQAANVGREVSEEEVVTLSKQAKKAGYMPKWLADRIA